MCWFYVDAQSTNIIRTYSVSQVTLLIIDICLSDSFYKRINIKNKKKNRTKMSFFFLFKNTKKESKLYWILSSNMAFLYGPVHILNTSLSPHLCSSSLNFYCHIYCIIPKSMFSLILSDLYSYMVNINYHLPLISESILRKSKLSF